MSSESVIDDLGCDLQSDEIGTVVRDNSLDVECVPEVSWPLFVQSFSVDSVSFEVVADFVFKFAHHRLVLKWPIGAELRFATAEMLGIAEDEVCRLIRTFICCSHVDVWVVGLAFYSHLSALVLVGEKGEFYAFNRSVDNALYRIADDAYGFWKRGLRRFDPVYGSLNGPVSDGVIFGAMRGVEDALDFAVAFDRALVPLPWPQGVFFEFSVPENHGDRWRFIPTRGVAVVIGRFVGRCLGRGLLNRQRVIMDQAGAVYACDANGGTVVSLARSFSFFLAIGARKLFKNYRFPEKNAWAMQLPVTCVHVPVIHLPREYSLSMHVTDASFASESGQYLTTGSVPRDCADLSDRA
ncbi:tegument protein UL23 [macacine betaherpesvirus 9]|uniref:Tegument protein UL23 n=1 Tax=macacine betaherpesvirus 9 TaxID=2560568 RepID=A0A191S3U6_9BETA|nr:tegument protein UL23 [macacine betaherpesvirus 9]ANC96559.1 tegument protein UL23 [macacine betaherpesvirus 9]